ncbi:MAG: cellulase family glycosylhydrolase, partial [Erysipelotrichaceae bacterium]|nr:cellulase family glycosylhydrolase [Erysipelotrichaceae bacterium]
MKILEGYQHGINLGGWFSQCDHTKERYDTFIRESDFAWIASRGFDHVRVPVDYELVLDKDNHFIEEGFERLERCMDLARKYSLRMILDLHKTPGFSFDDGEGEEGFFENNALQELFYGLWEAFAKRFGRREGLAFELLNEVDDPAVMDKWNEISLEAIRRIRVHAPMIPVLVGGYGHNSPAAVKDLAFPYDEHIVYNCHCYAPLIFTHQGAYWIDGMDHGFRCNFPLSGKEYDKLTKLHIGDHFTDPYPESDEPLGKDYFRQIFREAAQIAEERNVPLYCGEFGTIDRADPESTLRWLACITSVLDEYGIGRALWSY